jgi:hypothetical protein
MKVKNFGIESKFKRGFEKGNMHVIIIIELTTIMSFYLLTYLQFSVIKWAKHRLGQSPIDVKSDEAIQI